MIGRPFRLITLVTFPATSLPARLLHWGTGLFICGPTSLCRTADNLIKTGFAV
jgi:hypothetical protein